MKKKFLIASLVFLGFLSGLYFFALPSPLFDRSYSTVLYDYQDELLGARIAEDEQWRFPIMAQVDPRFEACILNQEDQYFRSHFGLNPVSLMRALYLNISEGKVVSGGSTISMQLIRLSRNNPPRTIWEKFKEIVLATVLETRYSKDEILAMYCTHAPFGGNVVGYETAAWRYFQRSPDQLSWAELATLAVLPNAPGLIHPGRNREVLASKRDGLLQKLLDRGIINQQDFELALLERLPEQPYPLPDMAPHLLTHLQQSLKGERVSSSVIRHQQLQLSQILNSHVLELSENKIHNGAILLINNQTGRVEAYVGNAAYPGAVNAYNDMLGTPRSSGSILKPLLYSAMLESGDLLPDQFVSDIPTQIGGFAPENFNKSFDGMVSASDALSRSLNVPSVRMLREYSIPKFLRKLQQLKFNSVNRSADHYGLSLILGGAEVTALELGLAYSAMAQKLSSYSTTGEPLDFHPVYDPLLYEEAPKVPYGEASIYQTFQVLTRANRPESENGWQKFGRADVAWKTGTSYGHRDAWAVGVTAQYTCVVWVGNASGEGRPGLVGGVAAGPILFEVMNSLPRAPWFTPPFNEMKEVTICSITGFKAGRNCSKQDPRWVPLTSTSKTCPYHQKVFVNTAGQRVQRHCAAGDIASQSYMVLPPTQAWYYSRSHPTYRPLPPWSPRCKPQESMVLEVIYPQYGSEIHIPNDIGGQRENLVLEVAHRDNAPILYWHLNGKYVGNTETFHQLALDLPRGAYKLHVEDAEGNTAESRFTVVSE